MNTIDWGIILIILIFMLMGACRGFISSVIRLVEYFLSIFLAYKLSPFFTKLMIEKWAIDEKITSLIQSQIPKIAENVINNSGEYKGILDAGGQNLESIKETLANAELPFLNTIAEKIIQIFAVIILFILFKFLFRLLSFVLNKIARIPVLKQFNKIGGMAIGFVEGVIVSIIIVVVISLLPNENLQNDLNNSFIGNKISQAVINITLNTISEKT